MKVISYLCKIFRKPTCGNKAEGRGIFTVASRRASGYAAWAPGGPQPLLPWEPNACYSPAVPDLLKIPSP